jgi:probable HAF family extracellular repeat protein
VEQKGHANVTRPPLTRAAANSILATQIVPEELRMNSKIILSIAAVVATAALVIPMRIQAQLEQRRHHHYKLVDVGTFGGPGGGFQNLPSPLLNNRGMFAGYSDTAAIDPFSPNCFLDCYVDQSSVLQNGVVTPLSPISGGASSYPFAINAIGQIAGISQNGVIDPSTGWPEADAVLWQDGGITNLGTLGGTQSVADDVNDEGQAVGAALNGTSDPFANDQLAACVFYPPLGGGCYNFTESFLFSAPATTETHAFVWTKAQGMQDLGTLGGPDSGAWMINDCGQITGESFISFTPNASSGVPTIDPFFWDPKDRKMLDLGGLGGTFGAPVFMNGQGQVIGVSNLPGDATYHPFIWSKSEKMKDLGTLGGTIAAPHWINDAGEVVGFSNLSGDQNRHAFLWRNGVMTDLGTRGYPESEAASINTQGEIVGSSFVFSGPSRGLIWENGAPPADLNALVSRGTTMFVTAAYVINDRGEIGCLGLDPGDAEEHACLLIPCNENHPGIEGCDYSLVDAATTARIEPPQKAELSALTDRSSDTSGIRIWRLRGSGSKRPLLNAK